jgi:hypothetical protein
MSSSDGDSCSEDYPVFHQPTLSQPWPKRIRLVEPHGSSPSPPPSQVGSGQPQGGSQATEFMVGFVFIQWPSSEWDSAAVPLLHASPCNSDAMLLEGPTMERKLQHRCLLLLLMGPTAWVAHKRWTCLYCSYPITSWSTWKRPSLILWIANLRSNHCYLDTSHLCLPLLWRGTLMSLTLTRSLGSRAGIECARHFGHYL